MIPFWETKRKGSGLIELKNYWMPYSYTLCIVSVESQRGTHSGSGVRLQEGVWREKRKSRHVTCFSQAPQGRNMLRGHGSYPWLSGADLNTWIQIRPIYSPFHGGKTLKFNCPARQRRDFTQSILLFGVGVAGDLPASISRALAGKRVSS